MNAAETARLLAKQGLLPAVYRSVEPAYPHEGCGFVFENEPGTLEVLPTKNRAQKLHEIDPERYPRGGADWFEPDMKPWLQSVRNGGIPRVIYHSHPDVGAYFSEGDRTSAWVEHDDGTRTERNEGVHHIVVSVREGRADGARMFTWDAEKMDFVQAAEFAEDGSLESVESL